MPQDAPKGKGLTKKVGGLPLVAWPALALGGYFVYVWYRNRQAAAAATGTTSGPPAAGGQSTPSTGTSVPNAAAVPGTLSQWIAQALEGSSFSNKYSQLQGYNDLTNYAQGNCVSSLGAPYVAGIIAQLGGPPGIWPAPISICATSPSSGATSPHSPSTKSPASQLPTILTPAALQSELATMVGALSRQVGRNAPQALVNQWWAQARAKGLTGTQAEFYAETQNVGYISKGTKTPTFSQAQALAIQGVGRGNWSKLSPLQQNQYLEIANVRLLQNLNRP